MAHLDVIESPCSGLTRYLLAVMRRKHAHQRAEKGLELRQKMLDAGVSAALVAQIVGALERTLAA